MAEQNTSSKRKATAVAAVALAAALLVGGGTYAYLQDESDLVTNSFETNEVEVDLTEDGDGQYEIVPGTSAYKNPTVTVDNTVDAYVFVVIDDETDGLVTYSIADGWLPLDEENYPGVYYREVLADDTTKTFAVLADNTVYYDASITNYDMYQTDEDGNYLTDEDGNYVLKDELQLSFKAYAIQMEPFYDADDADADSATAAYNAYTCLLYGITPTDIGDGEIALAASYDELVAALDDTDVSYVALTADVDMSDQYGTETDKTIDLNGNELTLDYSVEDDWGYPTFVVDGATVTVTDSSSDGSGTVTSTGDIGFYVYNSGELIIESGTYSATSSYLIYNAGSTVTITDGTFSSSGDSSCAIVYAYYGTVNISGGDFTSTGTSTSSRTADDIVFAYNSDVNITGGTYSVVGNGYDAFYLYACEDAQISNVTITNDTACGIALDGSSATITDATITVSDTCSSATWYSSAFCLMYNSSITVNGGTYTAPYDIYICNSGGSATINSGTFTGTTYVFKVDNDITEGTGDNDGSNITVYDGVFNGALSIATAGDTTLGTTSLSIYGGTFDADNYTDYVVE